MSDVANAFLNKPIKSCTEAELVELRDKSTFELKRRVFQNLELVADQYAELYGKKEGIEQMGEDLCKYIAASKHPEGWSGFVRHLMAISG